MNRSAISGQQTPAGLPAGSWMLRTVSMDPEPIAEEAAAIMAALKVLHEEPEALPSLKRSRWRLAGILGHAVEPGVEMDGSLWSLSRWEGKA